MSHYVQVCAAVAVGDGLEPRLTPGRDRDVVDFMSIEKKSETGTHRLQDRQQPMTVSTISNTTQQGVSGTQSYWLSFHHHSM